MLVEYENPIKSGFFSVCVAVFATLGLIAPAFADVGDEVVNVATVSHGLDGSRITFETPPAVFTIQAIPTPSTIEFFRISPQAPGAVPKTFNGSEFSDDDAQTFQAVGAPLTLGGQLVDLTNGNLVNGAENYLPGELVIVGVTDLGQNIDPTEIDSVVITITTPNDSVILRLFETGPDTGSFVGYVRSVASVSEDGAGTLFLERSDTLTAVYIDPFDATEVSSDVAGVDPYGRIFNSVSGGLIDGVVVTIVDAASGQPAPVFGIDGISEYPSTVTTGGSVTDASGLIYDLEPGEFLFPIMFPGEYRLELQTPNGFSGPSAATAQDFIGLPNAPFEIIPASFLGSFILDGSGDVNFDVPLDPSGDLLVTKTASTPTAGVGDFVRYAVSVENIGANDAVIRLQDVLPLGFRFQVGSARLDGQSIASPAISDDARILTFSAGTLDVGEQLLISYVAEVTSGADDGDAINTASVIDGAGQSISNTAQAIVRIEDDFLRDQLTIVGRIAANACDPNAPWPREISDGESLSGVRFYLETGAYVTSDEDGLFHFEDIDPKIHVVQMDTASLPKGYEPVLCEENNRNAGSAISQFVDAQGGSVWRTNFYLRRKEGVARRSTKPRFEQDVVNLSKEYEEFDLEWLNQQNGLAEWAYPTGETPSSAAISIGVKHAVGQRVILLLNGAKAPALNYAGREVSKYKSAAISRWRGVDLVDGENNFVAIIQTLEGEEVTRVNRTFHLVDDVARATFEPEESYLFADGAKPPAIAIKVVDGAGRRVRTGTQLSVTIDPPYRALGAARLEEDAPLTDPLAAETTVRVGANGVARIELEPTLQTGNARIRVVFPNGNAQEFVQFLQPALREWIVVGLAEGSARLERETQGNEPASARDFLRDGRVAVFAKGTVKGDWLVTAAVDTDTRRGNEDDELFDDVNPDDRFSIFGDRSRQQFEAQSRFPVYAKAEKGSFQALFGDYQTGLSEVRLGRYSRRLSGFQSIYEGERFRFNGFAAETNQEFIRDEIAANGTSGPFRLTGSPVVVNSDRIRIETRDRFRPDEIVTATTLVRYLDYDIDFITGEVIFRLPVPAAESENDFNVIVAEYETSAAVERDIAAGGRGAVRFLDGRVETGVTIIHEENSGAGSATESGADTSLLAVDLRADVTDTTNLRFEYGVSRRQLAAGSQFDNAISAEVRHASKRVSARAYFDEVDSDFGFSQQSTAQAGVRRYGGEANVRLSSSNDPQTGAFVGRYVDANILREENTLTGASRDIAEVTLRQEGDATSGSVGLRRVVERTADGLRRRSILATAEVRQTFKRLGLTVRAQRDQPIGADNESILFAKRTIVGIEQRFGDKVTLNVSHEVQESDNVSSGNTIVGVSATPWSGGRLTASADQIRQPEAVRLGATFGVDQQIRFSQSWTGSFGVTRRQELATNGVISQLDDIVPDGPISPLENTGDFTSLYLGAGYRTEFTQSTARFETIKSSEGTRYTGILSAARDVSEAFSLAGTARLSNFDSVLGENDERTFDARLGVAVRPRDGGVIIFNRLDFEEFQAFDGLYSWKVVNNLNINAQLNDRWQLNVLHGLKYASLEDGDLSFDGVTQLFGLESRYDITRKIDFGLRGSLLYSHNSDTLEYSVGPSFGLSPADNIFLSAGWNFAGFTDDDFSGAAYTRNGPFIQLRVKFDQTTAGGLLKSISPSADQ